MYKTREHSIDSYLVGCTKVVNMHKIAEDFLEAFRWKSVDFSWHFVSKAENVELSADYILF